MCKYFDHYARECPNKKIEKENKMEEKREYKRLLKTISNTWKQKT